MTGHWLNNFLRSTRLCLAAVSLTSIALASSNALSQNPERTHRVVELEEKLQQDAVTFLSNRFPNQPFSVGVTVEPLRRNVENYNLKGEQLPYFAIEEEGIRDEWDDPTVSLFTLLDRVKSIEINLQIPEGLTELEQSEMKEGLAKRLRLIPARDQILISQKKWQGRELDWVSWGIGTGLVVFALLGFFVIFRSSVKRVAESLSSIQSKMGSQAPPPAPPAQRSASAKPQSSDQSSSDMNVHDPIKTRELLRQRIAEFESTQDFFRLSNMLRLDEFGKKNAPGLGALLMQFSVEDQKKIFAYSHGRHWMQAFHMPGEVQPGCLRLAESLGRANSRDYSAEREELLIQLWRLEGQRLQFLKSIAQDEALSLLADLPKYLSIPSARAAFPGSWAPMLQADFKPKVIDSARLKQLLEISYALKPLNDFSLLDVFKRDQELVQFSQVASLHEEREIYQSLPQDSMLWELRPPFYPIFEAPDAIIKQLVQERPPQDWALILFNVPHESRRKVDQFIEGKFRFLFLEQLKKLDQESSSDPLIFDLRTEVGLRLQELTQHAKEEALKLRDLQQPSSETSSSDEQDESNAA